MLTFTEADVLAWVTPILWPFLRVLALFSALPVIAQSARADARAHRPRVPDRVLRAGVDPADRADRARLGGRPCSRSSSRCWSASRSASRCGSSSPRSSSRARSIGLQMGLNFAGFFNPMSGGDETAVSRFYSMSIGWLFIVSGGHLLVIAAVVQSFTAFPVAGEPFAFLRARRAAALGRRDLPPRPVDRAAAGRDAALHQPGPRASSRASRSR